MGKFIFGIFIFLSQSKDSNEVSPENALALQYVNQFNRYMVNEPDKAYEEIAPHSRPEKMLFNGSASFFKNDLDVNNCRYENEKNGVDAVLEIILLCPLKANKTKIEIQYQVERSSENDYSIINYQFKI